MLGTVMTETKGTHDEILSPHDQTRDVHYDLWIYPVHKYNTYMAIKMIIITCENSYNIVFSFRRLTLTFSL